MEITKHSLKHVDLEINITSRSTKLGIFTNQENILSTVTQFGHFTCKLKESDCKMVCKNKNVIGTLETSFTLLSK